MLQYSSAATGRSRFQIARHVERRREVELEHVVGISMDFGDKIPP